MADEAPAGTGTPAAGDPPAGDPPVPPSGDPPAGDPPAPPAVEAPPAAPVVPEKYELALPKDSTLDPAVLERTAATARELGLSQEHAQKTLDFVTAEVAAREAALLEDYKPGGKIRDANVQRYEADALADVEIGGSPEKLTASVDLAEKFLGTYGSEGMHNFLDVTGLGSHPELIRMFAKAAKDMGEGTFVSGAPTGTAKSAAEVLYPSHAKE